MTDIKSLSYDEILSFVMEELKLPKFRANQINDWLSKGREQAADGGWAV